jgi:hypothetical protein
MPSAAIKTKRKRARERGERSIIKIPNQQMGILKLSLIHKSHGKESTERRKSQIKGNESENSYQKLKRSLKDRHTQTHGNCIEIF